MKLLLLLTCGVAAMLVAPEDPATDCENFGCKWSSDITFSYLDVPHAPFWTYTCSTVAGDGSCTCSGSECVVADAGCHVGLSVTLATDPPTTLNVSTVGCGTSQYSVYSEHRRTPSGPRPTGRYATVSVWCTACDLSCEQLYGGGGGGGGGN